MGVSGSCLWFQMGLPLTGSVPFGSIPKGERGALGHSRACVGKIINPRITDIRISKPDKGLSVILDGEKEITLGTIGNGAG